MLRARIIAHPNQNTSSLHQSLKQSGYKVEQIAPGETAHHDAHLEINLTDGSFEWTEPDLPVAVEPLVESAQVAEVSEPPVPREFILAPLFRTVSSGWNSLRERARGGAAIASEGFSVAKEVGGNALASWKSKLNEAAASATARADEWKREMERKREQARRERAEKSLFAVPPKPPVAKVEAPIESPKVEAPKYEPVIETVKPEPVLERLQMDSAVRDEDTRILAAHEQDVPLFAEPPKVKAKAAAAGASQLTQRDRNWRQSMAVAAALVLAFLIGWSVGTRDDRPEFNASSDTTQAVVDSPATQPAVVAAKPATVKPVVEQTQVAKASKPAVTKHRVAREANEDDVDVTAEDVVVHHYPSIQQKYAKNNKQVSVKRISDIE
jgi:hypothetical protein